MHITSTAAAGAATRLVSGTGLNRRSFMLSSAGLLAAVAVAGPGSAWAQSSADATLKVGMARDFATFDPSVATTSTAIAVNLLVFERLYETSFADRLTRPMLAVGEPEKLSDTLYRVRFVTGHKFHNGEDVTAEDVAFSINRIATEDSPSFYRQFVPFIKLAKAAGDDAVEIELKVATDTLTERLSVVGIVPRSIADGDEEAFGANPVGSGPFRFISASANDRVLLERYDAYVGDAPGLVQSIEMRIITDPAGRIAALNTGEVSLIEEPADLDIEPMRAVPELSVELKPGFLSTFLMFNCSKAPFDDKRVRQALVHAIDRDELVNVALFGNGKVARTLLPEHHPDFRASTNELVYDPDKARALLAEAGYPDGLKIDGRSFVCQTYLTPWNEAAGNLIVSKWRDIGFDIDQNVGGEAIYSNITDGTYDLAIAITDQSWFGWDGPLLYEWFHGAFWSAQLNFFAGESATRIQGLLQGALQAGADVPGILAEVQQILNDEAPMTLMFHRDVPTAWRVADVDGVVPLQTAGLDVRTVSVKA